MHPIFAVLAASLLTALGLLAKDESQVYITSVVASIKSPAEKEAIEDLLGSTS